MDAPAPPPDLEATLAELATLGVRAVRVVTDMMEIEQAAAKVVATWLPNPAGPASSLGDAVAEGRDIDAVSAAMAAAAPRIEILARAHGRLSRSVRFAIALRRRLQTGWPRAASSDDRAAMQKRQVKKGVGDAIRREADEETAERLFDQLDEHLEDPGLDDEIAAYPVEDVVRRICRDIGLAAAACAPFLHPSGALAPRSNPTPSRPPDTG